MPEPDVHDTEPPSPTSEAPNTPRASGEQRLGDAAASEPPSPHSRILVAAAEDPAAPSAPSDTLLSAGKPADRRELLLEDRLLAVDQRLREVDERLHEVDSRLLIIERKRPIAAAEPRQKPWLWIAFLIALVVVFQLLRRVR